MIQYTHFEEFRSNPEALRSYSLIICRNVALRYLSHFLRDPVRSDSDAVARANTTSGEDPESFVIRSRLAEEVLLGLKEESRKLLDLLLKGYSTGEIADRLGIGYSAAAVRIHRLWAELDTKLK